jgi:lysophospholipase
MSEIFFDVPGNPRPDNLSGGHLETRDGHRLRYALSTPNDRKPSGTVVILTGRNEALEKYFETMRDLGDRNLASAIFDWRGQGGSGRMLRDPLRGHVRSFDDYSGDLDQFFTDVVLPDCRGPYFLLAHSTGALIALLASSSLANRVRRMVLVAPFLGTAALPFSVRTIKRVMNACYWMGARARYAFGSKRVGEIAPFATNRLTTDVERFRRNKLIYETAPELALRGPTVSWVRAACMAIEKVHAPAFIDSFHVPTLFVAAGADEIVSNRATEELAAQLKTASLITIPGARHELLQEADLYREQLLAAFDAFVPGAIIEPTWAE